MPDATGRLITVIEKNERERFIVSSTTFHNHRNIDVRVHALNADGDSMPTPKGISIGPQKLLQMIESLDEAERVAMEEDLIKAGGAQ